jgi:glycosyltransferase involved in cell wall biosynthesis
MTVSVIIPTRDRAALVTRALASVFAQTHPAEEVIVVDDGSSDDTAARVRSEFPGATVIRQESPKGVSAARNRGVDAAGGEWVAFLDSDDEWLPEKLARQTAALEREPGHVLCHSDEIWIRNGRRVNPRRRHAKHGGWIFPRCLPLCAISPSAAMIRRDVLLALGGFDESLPACEDYDLWLRLCARYPVLLVDEPLVIKYGGHADQLSRTTPALDRYRIRALVKILESGVLESGHAAATRDTLLAKIDIYLQGVRRRERDDEARELEALRQRYAGDR